MNEISIYPATDPVTTEIVRNGLLAVTGEMKTNLMRTAYNIIIYEALDFTVGLFTAKGETVSIGIGLPMFIRGMSETVKAKLKHFGPDGIEPGDILVTNDAYITGSHLNHVTFSLPIFHEGELIAFAKCMAHWIDIGGTMGGMTTDIYSEGLQIPSLKYQSAGVVNRDLEEIIRMNVRIPSRAMSDLRAQITAVKTGERRFLELVNRYGKDAVLDSISAIMDHAEAAARKRTLTIPDGVYEAESYMDDDGIDVGKPISIRVRIEVAGDEMTIDLSDVSDQVAGFYNSGIAAGYACTQVAFKCLTSPTDYPINDGAFRNLTPIVPMGKVVSAVKPAPMRWWMTFPMTVVDTIFKAMTPAISDRVIAGHHADLVTCSFHGINLRNREFFIGGFGPQGGGWGAKISEDGVSGTVCINDGDTHNSPIEQSEAKFPVWIESNSLIIDSGGPGEFRGGLGIDRIVRMRREMVFNTQIERVHCAPWGLEGGHDGFGNFVALHLANEWKDDFPNAKVLTAHLKEGEAFRLSSGGGGGFCSPLKRPAETVRHDVEQGYVSVESARENYGVVVDPETFELDLPATEKRRAEMANGGEGGA